ncbi:MAG: four helix bundle protein [bacterium]|nr:four helix bundle protein [bacterium]
MNKKDDLIPPHGGYRKLRSFQTAQLVYDATVVFCDRFVDKHSRTHDQMVQAARSGVQNIAEGSMASATSKKTELKLTGVARASLEELLLDYEDFLRQRGLPIWAKDSSEALGVRRKYQSDRSDKTKQSDPSDKRKESDRSDQSDKTEQNNRTRQTCQTSRTKKARQTLTTLQKPRRKQRPIP